MFVVFLYGGMIWGSISNKRTHLMGRAFSWRNSRLNSSFLVSQRRSPSSSLSIRNWWTFRAGTTARN